MYIHWSFKPGSPHCAKFSWEGRVACRELEPGSSLVGQTLSSPFSEEGEEEIVWKLWQEVYDASWKVGMRGTVQRD